MDLKEINIPFNSVLLIDGSNMLHRNFHGYPFLTSKNGIPTGAIYGTIKQLIDIQKNLKPLVMIFCLDFSRFSFRNKLYPDYKMNRPPTEIALKQQFELMKEFAKISKLNLIEQEDFEADDLIGSYSKLYSNMGFIPIVLSGDKDLFQLVNKDVKMIYSSTKEGYILHGEEDVKNRFKGLNPIQVIDLKGLAGDSSDNYGGVNGIGDVTATKLLLEFNSIEGIYENIDKISGKTKEKLIKDKENAFLCKKLATIFCDLNLSCETGDLFSLNSVEVQNFLKNLDITNI